MDGVALVELLTIVGIALIIPGEWINLFCP